MGMNWLLDPTTDLPSRGAKKISDFISPSNDANPNIYKGFLSGAVEGAGDYASGMTSPLALAGMAIGATPWLKGAKALTGLGRVAEARGISPSILPPGLISSGAEGVYNAAKSIPRAAKSLEDLAYEVVMNPNKIKTGIGGNFNVGNPVRNSVGGGMDTINEMRRIKEFRDAAKVMRGEVSTR
jgi:hypothetical protein